MSLTNFVGWFVLRAGMGLLSGPHRRWAARHTHALRMSICEVEHDSDLDYDCDADWGDS